MKFLLSLFVSLFLIGQVHTAEADVLKFAGGPVGLSYEKVPKAIKPTVDSMGLGFSLEVLTTQGGGENVRLVQSGKADFGIAPNKMASQAGLQQDGVIFNSYAQMVCNKERTGGVTSIKDLVDQAKEGGRKIQVAVGGPTSASRWVWLSLAGLDDDYGKQHFIEVPVSFTKAIPLVMSGKFDCAWAVSGLGSSAMRAADFPGSSKTLQLMAVDDWDFNDDDYDFAEIDSDTYQNLQAGWVMGNDIKTIKVPVVLFHRQGLEADNPFGYGIVSGEAIQAGKKIFGTE